MSTRITLFHLKICEIDSILLIRFLRCCPASAAQARNCTCVLVVVASYFLHLAGHRQFRCTQKCRGGEIQIVIWQQISRQALYLVMMLMRWVIMVVRMLMIHRCILLAHDTSHFRLDLVEAIAQEIARFIVDAISGPRPAQICGDAIIFDVGRRGGVKGRIGGGDGEGRDGRARGDAS